MSEKIFEALIKQLDHVIDYYKNLRSKAKYDDLSDLSGTVRYKMIAMAKAAIVRVAGSKSVYNEQAEAAFQRYHADHSSNVRILVGIIEAMKEDIQSGHFRSLLEIIHSDLFADFLEMAEHLLNEGYKDAAAVIAGSSLEAHLKRLCQKNRINISYEKNGNQIPKKASRLNDDLAKDDVYTKLDHKNIIAWLGLRNEAAHGNYEKYTKDQVAFQISGIRDFLTRIPA